MTLTLEVSPETVRRIEWAKTQGINMDTLLCKVLELLAPQQNSIETLAGKYEGEAWDELLSEIERNRNEQ